MKVTSTVVFLPLRARLVPILRDGKPEVLDLDKLRRESDVIRNPRP